MNKFLQLAAYVREFFDAFTPAKDINLWCAMVEEEQKELLDAMINEPDANILKELCDVMYTLIGLSLVCEDIEKRELFIVDTHVEGDAFFEEVEATCVAAKNKLGVGENTLMEAFYRVHRSNMSKLDANGTPIRRADGKIVKGPNYQAPDLTDLV